MKTTFSSRFRWLRLCGVATVGLLVFASLMLPTQWAKLRTGHWVVEHFLAYFAASSIICLGWRRPFVVAGSLMAAAVLLELLQDLTPSHTPDFLTALSGAGGALAAALLAALIIRGRRRGGLFSSRRKTTPRKPDAEAVQ